MTAHHDPRVTRLVQDTLDTATTLLAELPLIHDDIPTLLRWRDYAEHWLRNVALETPPPSRDGA